MRLGHVPPPRLVGAESYPFSPVWLGWGWLKPLSLPLLQGWAMTLSPATWAMAPPLHKGQVRADLCPLPLQGWVGTKSHPSHLQDLVQPESCPPWGWVLAELYPFPPWSWVRPLHSPPAGPGWSWDAPAPSTHLGGVMLQPPHTRSGPSAGSSLWMAWAVLIHPICQNGWAPLLNKIVSNTHGYIDRLARFSGWFCPHYQIIDGKLRCPTEHTEVEHILFFISYSYFDCIVFALAIDCLKDGNLFKLVKYKTIRLLIFRYFVSKYCFLKISRLTTKSLQYYSVLVQIKLISGVVCMGDMLLLV